jgi:hypothetical protein
MLQACSKDNPKLCIRIDGYQKYADVENLMLGENRVFIIHLPVGTYNIVFLNQNGVQTWPSFVLFTPEEVTCPISFPDDPVKLIIPPPGPTDCVQLVRNGNLESSDTEATFWLFRNGEVELIQGGGIGKSNAMAAVERSAKSSLVQYLDTRCMAAKRGRIFQFSAMIKLQSENGEPYICDSTKGKMNCPEIGYRSSDDGVFRTLAMVDSLSNMFKDGYQPVSAYFEVSDIIASSNQTLIYIQSNVAGKKMFVDEVSIKLVDQESTLCKNMIDTPDLFPSYNWRVVESGELKVADGPISVRSTKPSILFTKRRDDNDSIAYNNWSPILVENCLVPKSKWKATAQLQLIQRGKPVSCDISSDNCPALRFLLLDEDRNVIVDEKYRTYKNKNWDMNNFNVAEAIFTLPATSSKWDGSIARVVFQIISFPTEYDLIVGDVQFVPV